MGKKRKIKGGLWRGTPEARMTPKEREKYWAEQAERDRRKNYRGSRSSSRRVFTQDEMDRWTAKTGLEIGESPRDLKKYVPPEAVDLMPKTTRTVAYSFQGREVSGGFKPGYHGGINYVVASISRYPNAVRPDDPVVTLPNDLTTDEGRLEGDYFLRRTEGRLEKVTSDEIRRLADNGLQAARELNRW